MDKQIKIVLLTLLFLQCFGAIFFQFPGMALLFSITYVYFTIAYYKHSKSLHFGKTIIFFFVSAIMSILSCRYYRGQGLYVTFLGYNMFFALSFYFYLHKEKLSVPKMEQILVIFSILFSVLYIIQYIIFPIHIFSGSLSDVHATVENLRIRMVGSGFASLGIFMGINKILCKKYDSVYVLMIIMGFIVILMMGFRTLLAGILLMSVIMAIRISGISFKLLSLFLMGIVGLIIMSDTALGQHVIEEMSSRQESETFDNTEYIRWIELDHFTNNHFISDVERFFGSGIPSMSDKNSYSRYFSYLDDNNICFEDWGLWGCSWVMGIPSFVCMVWYAIKASFAKVRNKKYYYLGTWFLFMFIVSFTSYEFCRTGNFIVQAMVLYIIDKVYGKKKNWYFVFSSCRKLWGNNASIGIA